MTQHLFAISWMRLNVGVTPRKGMSIGRTLKIVYKYDDENERIMRTKVVFADGRE